jgi:plastocyanin
MYFKYFYALFLVTLCLSAQGASVTILVLNQYSKPIRNAVLTFPSVRANNNENAKIAVMDQINMNFQPRLLVVQQNQAVSFPNSDNIRHHVYSFSPAKSFELKLYRGKETQPIQMETPGIVALGCNIHDDMLAYIFVSDGSLTLQTDASGRTELALSTVNQAIDDLRVEVWHESFYPLNKKQTKKLEQTGPDSYQIQIDIPEAQLVTPDRGFKPKFNQTN